MNTFLKLPTVFLVDDERRLLKAIHQTLGDMPCKVEAFNSPLDCLQAMRDRKCALLITDVNMPQMSGLDLMKEAQKIWPKLPVLVMSGYGDIPMAVKAVKLGAIDFVEKPLDETTFVPLVEGILSDCKGNESSSAKPLTDTERTILALIGEGKRNKEIAHELDRSVRTIENHRARIMKKLEVDSSAELVRAAISLGLVSARP